MILSRSLLVVGGLSFAWLASEPTWPQPVPGTGDSPPHKDLVRRIGALHFRAADGVLSLAHSPDGKVLACGSGNDAVCLWDVDNGQVLRRLEEPWVFALAFSPDGKWLATGGASKVIRLWDVATGKEVRQLKGHQATIKALAFSDDGSALVSGGQDQTVRLWKAETGIEVAAYRGHTFDVSAVAISPDMKHLASGGVDGTIRVWEWGADHAVIRNSFSVTALSYLPNRKSLIAAGEDGVFRVWDIGSGKELRKWEGHAGGITQMWLDKAAAKLISSGRDTSVRIWDVATGKQIRKIDRSAGDGMAMAVTRDGKQIAAGGPNNAIRRWNAETGAPLDAADSRAGLVTAMAYAPDGKLAAAAQSTNRVLLLDLSTGQEQACLTCGSNDAAVLLAFAADGKTLTTASNPGGVIVWDVATANEIKRIRLPTTESVRCLAMAPDGKTVAMGHASGGLHIWNTAANSLHKHIPTLRGINAVTYSKDGAFLAVAAEDRIVLYDTATYQPTREFRQTNDVAASLAFSPDGRTLAAGMFGSGIKLYELAVRRDKSEAPPRTLEGHRGVVNSLAWSTNGRCLVSGAHDRTVRLWEFVNGQPIAIWHGHSGEATAVALHPASRTAISGSRDTTILVWDATCMGLGGTLPEVKPLNAQALEALWKEMASDNNSLGNFAMWTMVGAKDNAEFLAKKVFLTDPAKVKQHLENLNSNTFKVREAAFAALASYGRWIKDVLVETQKDPPSEEVRQRVTQLLQRLAADDAITVEQERLRARRVIEVLEQTNTPAARELLRGLSNGAALDDLRDMAKAALERAEKQ